MGLLASSLAFTLIGGANYADYHTTRGAISRGAVEVNPIYGSGAQRLTPIKLGVVAVETWGFHAIRKRHKKLAWAYVGAIVVSNGLAARHNHGVMR